MEIEPEGASLSQASSEWVNVTGSPPAGHVDETPSAHDGGESEDKSKHVKRRREGKERSRVSRACDRCKK